MPESNASAKEAMLSFFERQLGVARSALSDLAVTERDGEIWVAAQLPPSGIHSRRPSGLRALRSMPDGFKPTSSFLAVIGHHIVACRFDLDLETLRALLNGRRISVDLPDGYVALVSDGLVLGCGRVRRSALQALIPTGRRRELLEILG